MFNIYFKVYVLLAPGNPYRLSRIFCVTKNVNNISKKTFSSVASSTTGFVVYYAGCHLDFPPARPFAPLSMPHPQHLHPFQTTITSHVLYYHLFPWHLHHCLQLRSGLGVRCVLHVQPLEPVTIRLLTGVLPPGSVTLLLEQFRVWVDSIRLSHNLIPLVFWHLHLYIILYTCKKIKLWKPPTIFVRK